MLDPEKKDMAGCSKFTYAPIVAMFVCSPELLSMRIWQSHIHKVGTPNLFGSGVEIRQPSSARRFVRIVEVSILGSKKKTCGKEKIYKKQLAPNIP